MTTILALDLGTATGWALRTPEGQIISGTQSFKPGRYEGGGMRYLRFRAWLAELHTTAGTIGTVYFEEVRRHAGVDAAHVYGGLMATLTAWCEAHGVAYAGVPVGTIKKHATGKAMPTRPQWSPRCEPWATTLAMTTRPTRWRCCTSRCQATPNREARA